MAMTEFQKWKSQFNKNLIARQYPTTKVSTPTPKKTTYISDANKTIKAKKTRAKASYHQYRAYDWNTINKMSTQELQAVVKGLSVGVNARLRTIKANNLKDYSVWYHQFGGKVTPSNDRKELMAQYKDMNKFLNSRLSTVAGITAEKKRVAGLMGIDVRHLSTDVYQLLADSQGKMRELHLFGFTYDSEQFFDDVGTLVESAKDISDDDIVLEIRHRLNQLTDEEIAQYKDREWFKWE